MKSLYGSALEPLHIIPYNLKEGESKRLSQILSSIEGSAGEDVNPEKLVLCKYCRNKVARVDAKIQVDGHHQHIFTNPAGESFKIGCFVEAEGCRHSGTPTTAFTWFQGFSWQVAVCASCKVQLGWYYSSKSTDSFYGLILNHLVESE